MTMTPARRAIICRQHGVGAVVGAVQVGVDVFLEALRVGALEARVARHAGVVDQDVDGPRRRRSLRERGFDGVGVADVDDGRLRP